MRRIDLEAKTKQELIELARKRDIPGRSQLSKDGLILALLKDDEARRRPAFSRPGSARPQAKVPGGQESARAFRARADSAGAKAKAPTAKTPVRAGKEAMKPRAKETPPPKAVPTAKAMPPVKAMPPAKAMPPVKAAPPARATAPGQAKVPACATASRSKGARPKAAPATRERIERGGPFGPESERLHGPASAPPSVRARTPEPAPSATRTKAGEAAAPPAGDGHPRRGLGAALEIPEHYGRARAVLMARDPHWLYAYWEIVADDVHALRARLGKDWDDHQWVLRVFTFPPDIDPPRAEEGNGEDRYDIELPPYAERWYLNVGRSDRVYRIAVGVLTRSGEFHALVRSNAVRSPRDSVSNLTDEEWTRAPESYKRLYEMMGEGMSNGRSSAELGMLLRERLGADWSSGMMGSMASGALVRPPLASSGFWFVLDAELIIYGATEPDAAVTVQGRAVKLRPDGTFSLRFLLPDGTQVIDATAVSADGVFRKTITPTVRRETNATETIATRMES
ncbi:MAG: DUF4912 domain-containing protein [Candidatus Eisenbacteria bacterium]